MSSTTSPSDLCSNREFQLAALAAYINRKRTYEQGIAAVQNAAQNNLGTDAGRNLQFLSETMRETPFDQINRDADEAPWQLCQGLHPLPEYVFAPEDARDMDVVAPAQMKFVEMLFKEAEMMSMRQMHTLLKCVDIFVGETMVGEYEEAGCGRVGYVRDLSVDGGNVFEESSESSDGKDSGEEEVLGSDDGEETSEDSSEHSVHSQDTGEDSELEMTDV